VTWVKSTIKAYDKTKTKAKMANENRRVAQRLLMLESQRHDPKINNQVNHNKVLLTKKRK
jgi:hypothetical protein